MVTSEAVVIVEESAAVVIVEESAAVVIEASVTGEVKDVEVVRVSVASLEVLSVMGVL